SAHEGDDTVIGGQGNDSLTGGPGTDTLSYAQESTGPVTADLGVVGSGQATGGAGTDTLQDSFENLTGSPFAADILTGDNNPNFIAVPAGPFDPVACPGPPPPPPADSVRADGPGVDSINADCEGVDFALVAPPPADSIPGPTATQPSGAVVTKRCKKRKR